MAYNGIFKYRSIWMGIAIIWVFIYHMLANVNIPVVSDIINIGYAGCDIFFFASGIGIYYSLDKNDDLFSYFKKRIIRLMPLYWLTMVFWLPFRFCIGQMTVPAAIGSVFGIQYFIDWNYDYNWYIPVALLCYTIAPFIKKLLDRLQHTAAKLIILLIIICMSFAWSSDVMMMIGMTRLPVFALGMMFAQQGRRDKTLSVTSRIIWFILIPVGLGTIYYANTFMGWNGWKSGLLWLPMLIAAPGLCILISLIAGKLDGSGVGRKINRVFATVGNHSLEIYFAHVTVIAVFRDYMLKADDSLNTPLNWLIAIVISIAGAFLLCGVQRIIDIFTGSRKVRS